MSETTRKGPWTTEVDEHGRVYMHGPGCPEPDGEYCSGDYECISKNEAYALGRSSRDEELNNKEAVIREIKSEVLNRCKRGDLQKRCLYLCGYTSLDRCRATAFIKISKILGLENQDVPGRE